MRMWKVPAQLLCRQHLLGEHLEMHMFNGTINRGNKIDGYVKNGLVEPHNIKRRHDQLVREMKKRGYNHNSPMKFIHRKKQGHIDVGENIIELRRRCKNCKKRIERRFKNKKNV